MNQNKKIACFLVGLLVLVQAYIFLMVNSRAMAMKEEAEGALTASQGAEMQVKTQQFALAAKEDKSKASLKWLEEWEGYFQQTASRERAVELLQQRVKDVQLFETGTSDAEVPDPKGNYIPRTLQVQKSFHEDFHRTLQWLGDLEQNLPVCRISSLTITKGEEANHITSNVVVNLPMVNNDAKEPSTAAGAAGAAGAAAKPAK
jgi:hypothetical protein